jgi:hypothetical protein
MKSASSYLGWSWANESMGHASNDDSVVIKPMRGNQSQIGFCIGTAKPCLATNMPTWGFTISNETNAF